MKVTRAVCIWSAIIVVTLAVTILFGGSPHALYALDPDQAGALAGGAMLMGITLEEKWPTLLDVANRLDPNGNVTTVAEILTPVEEILDDIPFYECNDGTGHKTTVRTGIPLPTFRKLYGGVQPGKSTTANVRHGTGMMEHYAEIDVALAQMAANPQAWRLSEEKPFIQGFAKKIAATLFYGNEKVQAESFTGFSSFYSTFSAESGENIVEGGGVASNNTSIWLVGWGVDTNHGLYPRGSKAGLTITDKGQVTKENIDGQGGMAEMFRTHYRWDAGLAVRNWKACVRIANVDLSTLNTVDNLKNLITLMIEASERIDVPGGAGRLAFYCNRQVRTKLRLAILEKIGMNLTNETVAGKRVLVFDDIPVRRCDSLLNTEARVV